MQGLGTLLCAVVLVTLTQTLGDRYEIQWRLALLFGAFPMVVAFYFRFRFRCVIVVVFIPFNLVCFIRFLGGKCTRRDGTPKKNQQLKKRFVCG